MNTRSLLDNNRGDAVIVTTVLLMSIGLSLGGSMLIDYGEVVGKEDEMAHVSSVEDSLIRLRTSMYSLLNGRDTSATIVNRITLGTSGNPYLAVSRASGTLEIDPTDQRFSISLVVKDTVTGTETELNSVKGCISYETDNYYFHDQKYLYQAGAIVLQEYQGSTMTSHPGFMISESEGSWNVELQLYGLTSGGQMISGYESITLQVSMDGYSAIEYETGADKVLSLRINGEGERAWADHCSSILVMNGLVDTVDFQILEPADWEDPGQYVEIELLTLTSLTAQIGEMEVRY